MTTRRDLLKAGLAGATVLTAQLPRLAHAKTVLTGVTYLPPSYKALTFGSSGFIERLEQSEAVQPDFYDSGKLLKADEQLPALRSGNIDFMFHTTSYVTGSMPILGITGMPGIVEDLYENPDRLHRDGELFKLIQEELRNEDLELLSLGGNILEPEYIWSTAKSPIKSIDDISGKKIRVVSLEATGAMEQLGAGTVRISSSELYLALQRGTVDAAVANISTVIGRSLQEQVKYCYKLPTTAYAIGIFFQKQRWDSMDDEVKSAVMEAVSWFDDNGARVPNEEIYPNEYWPKVEEAGVEIVEASDEDVQKLMKASEQVLENWKEEVGADVAQKAIDLAEGKASS